ncbi:hypothetical protein ACUN9Y_19085 [Halomonas sp. V046]|uniref:hypothetical protein n=1 Tax=Halomonas sp. V046 TaxID=3459611 RepID=UPI004043F73E
MSHQNRRFPAAQARSPVTEASGADHRGWMHQTGRRVASGVSAAAMVLAVTLGSAWAGNADARDDHHQHRGHGDRHDARKHHGRDDQRHRHAHAGRHDHDHHDRDRHDRDRHDRDHRRDRHDRDHRRDRDDRYVVVDENALRDLFRRHRDWIEIRGDRRHHYSRGEPLPRGVAHRLDRRFDDVLPRYSGHQWRQAGSDALLVDVTTGVVQAVLRGALN